MKSKKAINTLATLSVVFIGIFLVMAIGFICLQNFFHRLETDYWAFPFTSVIYLIAAALSIYFDVRFIKDKPTKIVPLIVSACIIIIFPLLAGGISFLQSIIVSESGMYVLAVTLYVTSICARLAWFLWIGVALLIAASIINTAIYKTEQEN